MVFQAEQVSGGSRWPLVRIHVGARIEVVSLADSFLPLSVHWTGRSVVCCGDACDLCELLPVRGLFYLPVMHDGRTSILELAVESSAHLEMHCKLLHGGLKAGLVVQLSRRTKKSPVYSEVTDCRVGVQAITRERFASRVAALYHLPPMNPDDSLASYELRLQTMSRVRNKHAAARLLTVGKGVAGRTVV